MTSHEFQEIVTIPRKRTIKRRHEESDLQAGCVAWFRTQYPKLAKNLFAIPSGGKRNKITGAMLKREGALPGIPDLFLAKPKYAVDHYLEISAIRSGMFIEMKIAPNKPSPEQLEMIALFRSEGYYCCVCYSIDEFIKEVRGYLG